MIASVYVQLPVDSWAAIDDASTAYETRRFARVTASRSEEHTSELQSRRDLVCRLLFEKKTNNFIPLHLSLLLSLKLSAPQNRQGLRPINVHFSCSSNTHPQKAIPGALRQEVDAASDTR